MVVIQSHQGLEPGGLTAAVVVATRRDQYYFNNPDHPQENARLAMLVSLFGRG